jgi:hypothetical protein
MVRSSGGRVPLSVASLLQSCWKAGRSLRCMTGSSSPIVSCSGEGMKETVALRTPA